MALIPQPFLVPVSTVSSRNSWHNEPRFACVADAVNLLYRRVREPAATQATPDLCPKYDEKARGGGGGGYFQKNWVWMWGTLRETLTVFQTKICDFSYPFSDLTKNLIPFEI